MGERDTAREALEAPSADRGLELYSYLRPEHSKQAPGAPRAVNRSRSGGSKGEPPSSKVKISQKGVEIQGKELRAGVSDERGGGVHFGRLLQGGQLLSFCMSPGALSAGLRLGEGAGSKLRGGVAFEARADGDVRVVPGASGQLLLQRSWRTHAQIRGDVSAGVQVAGFADVLAARSQEVHLTTPVPAEDLAERFAGLDVARVDAVEGVDGRFLRRAREGFDQLWAWSRLGRELWPGSGFTAGAPWEDLTPAELEGMAPGERWVLSTVDSVDRTYGVGASGKASGAYNHAAGTRHRTGVVVSRPEEGPGLDVLRLDAEEARSGHAAEVAYGGGVAASISRTQGAGAGRFARFDPRRVDLSALVRALAGGHAEASAAASLGVGEDAVAAGGRLLTSALSEDSALGVHTRSGDLLGARGAEVRVGDTAFDLDLELMGAHGSARWTDDLVQVFGAHGYAARLDTSAATASQSRLAGLTLADRHEWAAAAVHRGESGEVSLRISTEQGTGGLLPSEQGLEAVGLHLTGHDIAAIAARASDRRWPEVIRRMTSAFQPLVAARATEAWRRLGEDLEAMQGDGALEEGRAELERAARMAEAVRAGGPGVGMALVQVARGLRDEARLGQLDEWPPDLAEAREQIEGLGDRVAVLPALIALGASGERVADALAEEIRLLRERAAAADFTNPAARRDLLTTLSDHYEVVLRVSDGQSATPGADLPWWLGELRRFKALEAMTVRSLRRELKQSAGRWLWGAQIEDVCKPWVDALPHWWATVDAVRQRYVEAGVPPRGWRVAPPGAGRRGLEPNVPRLLRLLGDARRSDRGAATRVADRARRYRYG